MFACACSCLQQPPLAHGAVSMLPARNSLGLGGRGGGGGVPPVRRFRSEGDLSLSEQGCVFLTLGLGARTEEVIHLRVELGAALAAALRAR
jgi:hypothetical protein